MHGEARQLNHLVQELNLRAELLGTGDFNDDRDDNDNGA